MQKEYIVGILIGNGLTSEEVELKNCPFCTLSVRSGDTIAWVFTVPPDHRWWLQFLEEKPQLVRLTQAEVFFTEKVDASSPWTRDEVKPDAPAAPCGADCRTCPCYERQ